MVVKTVDPTQPPVKPDPNTPPDPPTPDKPKKPLPPEPVPPIDDKCALKENGQIINSPIAPKKTQEELEEEEKQRVEDANKPQQFDENFNPIAKPPPPRLYAQRNMDNRPKSYQDARQNLPTLTTPAKTEISEIDSFSFDDTKFLFATSPSTTKTGRGEECTNNDGGRNGAITGIGPACEPQEIGNGHYHDCVHEGSKQCWYDFYGPRLEILRGDPINSGGINIGAAPYGIANDPVPLEKRKDDCLQRVIEQCTCSDCIYDTCMYGCDKPTTGTTGPPTVNGPNTPPTTAVPPPLTSIGVSTSSWFIPIPILYGRYIVAGNIFWLGDITVSAYTLPLTHTQVDTAATLPVVVQVPRASFAVGVAAGIIDGITRVWVGDTLIYNAIIDGSDSSVGGLVTDNIDNTVLFSNNAKDAEYYDTTKVKLTFYTGSEDQVAPDCFGPNAPAYRGLAYLLVENFNLSFAGGGLPEIKIEVSSKLDTTVMPLKSLADTCAYYVVDYSRNRLITLSQDRLSINTYVYDSLAPISTFVPATTTPIDVSTFKLLLDGKVVYQLDTGNRGRILYTVDLEREIVVSQIGSDIAVASNDEGYYTPDFVPVLRSNLVNSFHGYYVQPAIVSGLELVTRDYLLTMTPEGFGNPYTVSPKNGGVAYSNLSLYGGEEAAIGACIDVKFNEFYAPCFAATPDDPDCFSNSSAMASAFCEASIRGNFANLFSSTLFEYTYDDAGDMSTPKRQFNKVLLANASVRGSYLNLDIIRIADNGILDTDPSPLFTYNIDTNYRTLTTASIDTGLKGVLTGTGMFHDSRNKALIVFVSSTSAANPYAVMAIDTKTLALKWLTLLDASTPANPTIVGLALNTFTYLDGAGTIVSVNLSSGVVVKGGATAFTTAVNQSFDPYANSVVFVDSATGFLYKLYVARVEPIPTSFEEITLDLCLRSGLRPTDVDVTDVHIPITGYYFGGTSKPSDALVQLTTIYPVTPRDEVTLKFIQNNAASVAAVTLTPDIYNASGYARTRADSFTQPASLVLSYSNILDYCNATSVTVKTAIFLGSFSSLDDLQNLSTFAPLVFDPSYSAQAAAERLFAVAKLPASRGSLVVGSNECSLSVGDYIQADGELAIITEIVYNLQTRENALQTRVVYPYIDDFTVVSVVPPAPSTGPQTGFVPPSVGRARVFYLPALYKEEQRRVSADSGLFYVGVNSLPPNRRFATIGYKFGGESAHGTAGDVTDALHLGVSPSSSSLNSQPHTASVAQRDGVLTVRFDRAATVTALTSKSMSDTIVDKYANLIVVGDEVVQYSAYTVAPDGLTVTFTGLVRGRLGTDVYMAKHVDGEDVLVPTPESLVAVTPPLERTMFSYPLSVKVFGGGPVGATQLVDIYTWKHTGILTPSPVQVKRYGTTSGALILDWEGRTLAQNELYDYGDTGGNSPSYDTYDAFVFKYGLQKAEGGSGNLDEFNPYGEVYTVSISNFPFFGITSGGGGEGGGLEGGGGSVGPDTSNLYAYIDDIENRVRETYLGTDAPFLAQLSIITKEANATIIPRVLTDAGVNPNGPLYVVIARFSGANMKVAGHPSLNYFPPGTYDTLPSPSAIIVDRVNQYVVMAPGKLIMPKAAKYLVVRHK